MSRPARWLTPSGKPSAELAELIARARTGERWLGIAATFYPNSGNGIRKAVDVFAAYASDADKATRRAALVKAGFNRSRGPANPPSPVSGVIEPPLRRENADPWAGLGACFANPPARPAA